MQVKIFHCSSSGDLDSVEAEINGFLANLDVGAVRHVQTSISTTPTSNTDMMQLDCIVTVWYEPN